MSAKKLENTGLFESSRMMLFEHKDQYLEHHNALSVPSPRLQQDEQAVESYFRLLQQSLEEQREVRLTVFDAGAFVEVAGVVQQIDPYRQRFKFIHDFLRTWINFTDVTDVEEV